MITGIRCAGFAFVAVALIACSGGGHPRPADAGTRTPPTGTDVSMTATLPALSNAMSGPSTTLTAAGACTAANVGRCGCLEQPDWYLGADGTVYDVICCTAAGDSFTLYSCGNNAICDDDEGHVVCE
jgi:hypothetical protein